MNISLAALDRWIERGTPECECPDECAYCEVDDDETITCCGRCQYDDDQEDDREREFRGEVREARNG